MISSAHHFPDIAGTLAEFVAYTTGYCLQPITAAIKDIPYEISDSLPRQGRSQLEFMHDIMLIRKNEWIHEFIHVFIHESFYSSSVNMMACDGSISMRHHSGML